MEYDPTPLLKALREELREKQVISAADEYYLTGGPGEPPDDIKDWVQSILNTSAANGAPIATCVGGWDEEGAKLTREFWNLPMKVKI